MDALQEPNTPFSHGAKTNYTYFQLIYLILYRIFIIVSATYSISFFFNCVLQGILIILRL